MNYKILFEHAEENHRMNCKLEFYDYDKALFMLQSMLQSATRVSNEPILGNFVITMYRIVSETENKLLFIFEKNLD